MNRDDLAAAILLFLEAAGPMTAKEIEDHLRKAFPDEEVGKNQVTSVIGNELAGRVSLAAGRYSLTPVPPPPPPPPPPPVCSTEEDSEPEESALNDEGLARIRRAIAEEIRAVGDEERTCRLEIDGIEQLAEGTPGRFVYRLVLSANHRFSPDQTLTFQTTGEPIAAVVVREDDSGLVVECQSPLPPDARLLTVSFDPRFILRALEECVLEMAPCAGAISQLFASGVLPPLPDISSQLVYGLNEEQSAAVERMIATHLYLLWGPPGTGKTKMLGAAISKWVGMGKRVLLLSTSNAAVDVAMRAVLERLHPDQWHLVLRLGSSTDPVVGKVTTAGRAATQNAALAEAVIQSRHRLNEIRELLQNRCLDADRLCNLFAEAREHEDCVRAFNAEAAAGAPTLRDGLRLVGCTLSKMVLDRGLRAVGFDVVVVDEASMAPLLFALTASFFAREHLVYAGDPKQLPPIVQADGPNARFWFGRNVYDWFRVRTGDNRLSLLVTQYRMTDQIGGLVGRLCYAGFLRHGRRVDGPKVQFVNIDEDWQETYWSREDNSYFHLAAIPLLHALAPHITGTDLLLLSPFRPQRSLLAALACDLNGHTPGTRPGVASTIHRSQGSEAGTVVVDLTAHSPRRLASFFEDRHSENLFNVAVSRARDRLIILGSQAVLRELATDTPFWRRVIAELGERVNCLRVDELVSNLEQVETPRDLSLDDGQHHRAIYSHHQSLGSATPGIRALRELQAGRKLLVLPPESTDIDAGGAIVRRQSRCVPVFMAGNTVCVPYRGKWLAVRSPNVSRVIWRVGFSHLACDEVDPSHVRRLFCPTCLGGNLTLARIPGEGSFLLCTNRHSGTCHYRRRLSLADAQLLVQIQNVTCPEGHPLTARASNARIFLGCENYPECKHTASLDQLLT